MNQQEKRISILQCFIDIVGAKIGMRKDLKKHKIRMEELTKKNRDAYDDLIMHNSKRINALESVLLKNPEIYREYNKLIN